MKNFKGGKTWGVLGKQKTYYPPTHFMGAKVPLNANPLDAWDVKKSRYRRVDGMAAQEAGVPEPSSVPSPTPTPTPVPQALWVAGGNFETGYSFDSVNWSAITMPYTYFVATDIISNGSRWVTMGTGYPPDFTGITQGVLMYSNNGINWNSGTTLSALCSSTSALANNGSIWVAGFNNNYTNIINLGRRAVGYSYDGINYSAGTITPAPGKVQPQLIQDVAYGNGIWVGVGSSTGTTAQRTGIIISNDGIDWSGLTTYDNVASFLSVAYGNGRFVASQQTTSSSKIIVSYDGMNWSASTNANSPSIYGTGGSTAGKLSFFDGKFIGTFGSTSTTVPPIVYSTDGFIWSASTSSDLIMNNARWIASNNSNQCLVAGQTTGSTAGIYTSSNGIDWSNVGGSYTTLFTANTMTCVASNLPPF